MSARDEVLVHYHEVGLKGRNRKLFEDMLMRNIARASSDLGATAPRRLPGRIVIPVPAGVDPSELTHRAASVYGVANAAPTRVVPTDLDAIFAVAGELMTGDYDTFAVRARVSHSDFPMRPQEINEKLGAWLIERHGKRVNLSAPDRTCRVEVVADRARVSVERSPGAGGLPVGVSGRVAVLLSSGFDSPVAAARMMRRGSRCSFVHFHSQPFTDGSSVRNATELAQILTRRQYDSSLWLVALAPSQQAIVAACPEAMRTILYRRMMMRIAGALAEREEAQALVTGDSLGQVASQTLENLAAVEDASPLPVLRPLIGNDKLEIIAEAERLGTAEVASAPCQEACVLFEPKRPVTKARIADLQRAERALELTGLVEDAVVSAERIALSWPDP